jgi:hypothetical protein
MSLCSDNLVRNLWNETNISWDYIASERKSGSILAMWKDNCFKVESIEFSGQWIALFGYHVATSFHCVIVGVYAIISAHERRILWKELITLKSTFDVRFFLLW